MKRFCLFVIMCMFVQVASAQQLTIEGINKGDMTTERKQFVEKDKNDTPCALIIVNNPEVRISGNVIGSALQNGKEVIYNVASGTKKIIITKKGSIPLNLNVSDHGIKYLESNFVYTIGLKETTLSKEISGSADGHDYVDLGLSVKWATMNLGANSALELGNRYVYYSKDPVSKDTQPTVHYRTFYNSDYDGVGYYGRRRLKKEEDVARNTCGKRWRLPTKAECLELYKLKQVRTFRDGQEGLLFMASNGNTLFFPFDEDKMIRIAVSNAGLSHDFVYGYDNSLFWSTENWEGDFVRPVLDEYPEAEDWQFMYSLKPDGYSNGYGYIDLGLSALWATCNMGANDPTTCGDSYAWGETKRKESYTQENYKYSIVRKTYTGDIIECYRADHDNSYGTGCNRFLDSKDDAARVGRGSTWQMPEWKHFEELKSKCEWKWTYNYKNKGIHGYFIISKVPGYTDKAIFLPADADDGASLPYWTNEVDMEDYSREGKEWKYLNRSKAYALGREFIDSDLYSGEYGSGIDNNKCSRWYALYIRPIIKKR